ncbi:MAG: VWA domain-containing protein [Phycisphaeraceae bacterium]|nr:VWA domain-containing protein [Phycisphaeraceae bacterium]
MRSSRISVLTALVGCIGLPALAQPTAQPEPPVIISRPIAPEHAETPKIQLAILLDTSGSMDGLIEQAKAQLWSIVNELALARQGPQRPTLEVALYEYGKQSIPMEENQLRQILPFTADLDAVSLELFKLETNGGEEYCGAVIEAAVKGLQWSQRREDLKMIVIAGNEPFTQGGVDFHQSVPEAIARGIVVNTIFCGNEAEGISTGWQEGAQLADGQFSIIDQNAQVEHIPAPQDDELMSLSIELNTTYLGYGAHARAGVAAQTAADAAAPTPAVAAERANAKASHLYDNRTWDLVDAVREEGVEVLASIDEEALPDVMKDMDGQQRVLFIAENQQKRDDLAGRIQTLSQERDAFIAQERQRRAESGEALTFGQQLIKAIREQAQRVGLNFDR